MLDNCLYVFQLIIKFKSKRYPSSVTQVRPLFSLSPRGSDNSPLLILIMFRYNSLYDTKDKHSNHDKKFILVKLFHLYIIWRKIFSSLTSMSTLKGVLFTIKFQNSIGESFLCYKTFDVIPR